MKIPFEAIPSTSNFFLDYIRNWDKVAEFFCHDYALETLIRFAGERAPLDVSHRERLAAALAEQGQRWGAREDHANKLRAGAVAVVTGQQAGLFTGPLYAVLKALTAIKIARFLEGEGIAAVPVFWIASEDHDHSEIEWAGLLSRDSTLHRVRADVADGNRTPAGWLRFGPGIEQTIEESFSCLPESEFSQQVRSVVSSAYIPGASPVDAFGRIMTRLFEKTSLVLADPLDSSLEALYADVLREAADKTDEIRAAVTEETRLIRQAGYSEQVRVDDLFTGLFAINGTSRDLFEGGRGPLPGTRLSPNVLLRPVVQDSLLPTVAYVGGPSEIAYLAQASAIYRTLKVPMPPVFPRITATLIEPQVSRILKKYDLSAADVFLGEDALRSRVVSEIHDARIFDEVREQIEFQAQRLRSVMHGVDQTLDGALDNSIQKMTYQVNTLQSRFVNAESRRNAVLGRQLRTITNRLFPERKLQERVVNVTSFLVRYGWNLVSLMDGALDLDPTAHQAVEL